MHWQDAVKASNIGRAVRSYDKDRAVIRSSDGSCYLQYSDTGKYAGRLADINRVEGLLDWLPENPVYRPSWFVRLVFWIKRRWTKNGHRIYK